MSSALSILSPVLAIAFLAPASAWSQLNPELTSSGGKEVSLPGSPGYGPSGPGTFSLSFPGDAQSAPEAGTATSLGGKTVVVSTSLSSSGPYHFPPGSQTYYSLASAYYYQTFFVSGPGTAPVDINLQATGLSSSSGNGFTSAGEQLQLNQITPGAVFSTLGPDLANAMACASSVPANCSPYPQPVPYPQSFSLNETIALTPGDFYQLYLSSTMGEYSPTPNTPVSVSSSALATVNLLPNEGQYTLNYYPALISTPEPSTLALLGSGALGIAGVIRRRYSL